MEIAETNRPAVQEREHPRSEQKAGIAHEEIRIRAYYCWLDRGGPEGSPEQDWQQAEDELRAEKARVDKKSKTAAASS